MMNKFFRICIGLLFAGVCTEIILRFVPSPAFIPLLGGTYDFHCYAPGDTYWIALKKDASCVFHSEINAFPDTTVHTNNIGLRGTHVAIPKPDKTTRILVLGDSFTMGIGVSDELTYPSQIQNMLRQQLNSDALEVVNAGVSTADVGYYYTFLKERAPQLQPDIIVIGYYVYNDTHDEEMNPKWTHTDTQGFPTSIDSSNAFINNDGEIYSKNLPFNIRNPILRQSYTAALLSYTYYKLPFVNKVSKIPLVTDQICLFKSTCHRFDEEKRRAEKLLTAMRDISVSRNLKLIVALIPVEFQIYDDSRYKYKLPLALSPEEKQFPNKELVSFLTQQSISTIDLLPVFIQNKSKELYYKNDQHWTPAGHTLAATVISRKILELISP